VAILFGSVCSDCHALCIVSLLSLVQDSVEYSLLIVCFIYRYLVPAIPVLVIHLRQCWVDLLLLLGLVGLHETGGVFDFLLIHYVRVRGGLVIFSTVSGLLSHEDGRTVLFPHWALDLSFFTHHFSYLPQWNMEFLLTLKMLQIFAFRFKALNC
jgi:hypothetical protein